MELTLADSYVTPPFSFLYSSVVKQPDSDQIACLPERVLAAAGDVLPLLAGQLEGRVHGLLLTGIQEPGAVREQDSTCQGLKHTPQGITRGQGAACTNPRHYS